ncbi:MAG: hypothetical protein FWE32_02630 [Oscillospiraceae bacterium]|nr:hypothetical protein [Oscillospiraceae bacterium]
MQNFTDKELEDAGRAIGSLLHKCEKAGEKLAAGTSQHTLLINRIKALKVAAALIEQAKSE